MTKRGGFERESLLKGRREERKKDRKDRERNGNYHLINERGGWKGREEEDWSYVEGERWCVFLCVLCVHACVRACVRVSQLQ